ncbi:siderophore biosynthesis protein [Cupriavidus sp. MP-37]|uniref:siderophore biosynthesis protein n=1 Tax=Cupriavidus sp. MP-37 TaxID=2884455 RepID=UPI001D0B923E|nr:siderophore biosynthesis protein [Cupriavidus sp. MP-37]UDM53213.1 siderophore biosynthesis protein [Cupriavidus sp. MP-37]
MQEIFVLAHVPTPAVNEGFLPAARALGRSVVLLTDCADAHRAHFAGTGLPAYPADIVPCDVFNPLAVIDAITRRGGKPAAVFSNSDHLQAATAIAAAYFGLPGKDWRTAYAAKNKAEMRRRLAASGIDTLWHAVVCDSAGLAALADVPMPCIVKPREGVASQQVSLARSHAELAEHCGAIWARHPGQALLLEEYLEGPLYTLETLGDGKTLRALGGFRVTLSPPPYFVELEAVWGTGLPAAVEAEVLDTIRRFGIGFGACHTEYVLTAQGPRLIEINYRSIGDYREFLLSDTLQFPLFEQVLRLHLGEALPTLEVPRRAAWIRYFTAQAEGTLRHAPAHSQHEGDGVRLTYQPLRKIGDAIQLTNSNKDYLGVLRGSGPDSAGLAAAVELASSKLAWEIAQ